MHDMPNLLRDCPRLDKEVVRPLRPAFPRPLQVDHGVDNDIGHVHALWAQLARHRLGQDPLRRLGRRETGEAGFAPQADVLPVATMAPLPALTIAGAKRLARYKSPIVLTWKFRFRIDGSISWNVPNAPPTALWTITLGLPRSRSTADATASTCTGSDTSQRYPFALGSCFSSAASRSSVLARRATR